VEDLLKIKVLGAFGSEGMGQRPSAFLVDDRVLVDAGTVGGALGVAEQVEIQHALISHAHLDHTAGLAFLTDTLAMVAPERQVTVSSIGPVIDTLRTHAFNDTLWPNFAEIPSGSNPVLGFRTLAEEAEARVGELWVTPVPVDHTVPTTGYIIHDGETGFVYSGDTGPTRRLWQVARELPGLRALIVETAFPNRLHALARVSGHLTPDMLRREIDKMPSDIPIWIFHIKPQLFQETAEQIATIDPARIHTLEQGKTYSL
jgi:cAMP phosphodiesterase